MTRGAPSSSELPLTLIVGRVTNPIARGAALSRVSSDATVISSQAVRHYGVKSGHVFDPIVDRGRPSYVNVGEAITRVKKVRTLLETARCAHLKLTFQSQMTWYIYKGEDLKRDQIIKFPFFRILNGQYNSSDLIYYEDLFFAETNVAPDYPGPTVKTACRLRSDLSSLNKQDLGLRARTGVDGKPYYDLNFCLVLSTAEANLMFSLEINGKVFSTVEATYT